MATLTNPVNAQNIVDRFADYVRATANAGIVWHSGNLPFPEFNPDILGPDTGKDIEINGTNIKVTGSETITASNIYNTLIAETNRYTRIRLLRARLIIGTGDGNATRPASDALDLVNVASMVSDYQGDIGSPANAGVASSSVVTFSGLENFFSNLRDSYNQVRNTEVVIDVTVCHSSCHSACHSSRARR